MEVVALSGGKDSTAMALRLAEVEPGTPRAYLCTPTGDELPEMHAHWSRLECLLGAPLVRVTNRTLDEWIGSFGALPNWRQRWCTRLLKIEPCIRWIREQPERPTLCVGLRADEPMRDGIYSSDVTSRFPLREWGWGIDDVRGYLRDRGVTVPRRTDCARCYGQRLSEWWELWREHPDVYDAASAQEDATGHTFRSPGRDTWPARLADLAVRFGEGRDPRGVQRQLSLIDAAWDDDVEGACRVCRM